MRVVAIVPAYNEEKTIANVLSVLTEAHQVATVIVVNDGSSDKTAQVAAQFNVILINLEENQGKGGAMLAGLGHSVADIFLFLDADLIGLRLDHIETILAPVLDGRADMSLGLFEKGRVVTDLAQKMAPYLSGQRAMRTKVLKNIEDFDISRFGVEMAITKAVKRQGFIVTEVQLKDLSHVTKEEKLGVIKGLVARLKMYVEIARALSRMDEPK